MMKQQTDKLDDLIEQERASRLFRFWYWYYGTAWRVRRWLRIGEMITTTEIERNRKAWELVQRIADGYPGANCNYCGGFVNFGDTKITHNPDCIWLQARRLVEGE